MMVLTPKSFTAQRNIILSDSVPPEVKIISCGSQLRYFATLFRAVSVIDFAVLPKPWVEEGFPKVVDMLWVINSMTSFRMGVVAALSKYTFINSLAYVEVKPTDQVQMFLGFL
jgi:hypothetical protein